MILDRRAFGRLAAAAVLAAAMPAMAFAQSASPRHDNKVVVQVSDGDAGKWNMALNNIEALRSALGAEGVEIELVAYGPGIGMLKTESPVAPRIAEALKAGVRISACENTMKRQKLVPAQMLPDIGYVPYGAVEIVRKQQQGWAYVLP